MTLNKYLVTIKLELNRLMEYRINFFLRLCINTFVPLVIKYYLLTSLFQLTNQNNVGGFSEQDIVVYTLWSTLIVLLVEIRSTIENIAQDIRLGRITRYLLYPISMFEITTFQFMASLLVQTLCFIASAAALHFFVDSFTVQLNSMGFYLAITYVLMGSLFWYLVHFTIGLFTFWLDEIWPFFILFQLFARFLSGSPFPLDWFPEFLQKINYFLPFQWFLYVPARLFAGAFSVHDRINGMPLLAGIPIMLCWCLIIYMANKYCWQKGIKKYSAAGM